MNLVHTNSPSNLTNLNTSSNNQISSSNYDSSAHTANTLIWDMQVRYF